MLKIEQNSILKENLLLKCECVSEGSGILFLKLPEVLEGNFRKRYSEQHDLKGHTQILFKEIPF